MIFRIVIATFVLAIVAGCSDSQGQGRAEDSSTDHSGGESPETRAAPKTAETHVGELKAALIEWPVTDRMADERSPRAISEIADGRFVAGCRIASSQLLQHPYFGLLPLDRIVPAPLSIGRLEALGVEELVILCGPRREDQPQASRDKLEWIVSARLSEPVDLPSVLNGWRQSLVDKELKVIQPKEMQIGEHDAWKIPAGTFIPRPRQPLNLSFTDRAGEPVKRGLSVGRTDLTRSFIGDGRTSAIFTLENIGESSLTQPGLELEAFTDVFLTMHLDKEFSGATIEVRNPDTGLFSQPIRFPAKSWIWQQIVIPRQLESTEREQPNDLLTDYVSDGQLEIVIRSDDETTYLGLAPFDLRLRSKASEYVYVDGNNITVTRSAETLHALVEGNLTSTTALWPNASEADIEIVAYVEGQSDRESFKQVCERFGDGRLTRLCSHELRSMSLTVDVSAAPALRLSAEFADKTDATRAAGYFETWISQTLESFGAQVADQLEVVDIRANLAAFFDGGRILSFPQQDSPLAPARVPAFSAVLDDIEESVNLQAANNRMTLSFTQPQSLTKPSAALQIAITNLAEAYAHGLCERARFDLSDEINRYAVRLFPDVMPLRFRRAWNLAYNVRAAQTGYNNQYQCVRRALEILLDVAERHPNNTDTYYILARIVRDKVAIDHDHVAMQRRFANDERLMQRFGKLINLNQLADGRQGVRGWVVAGLLYEVVVRHATTDGKIPPVLLHAGPAMLQALHARQLSDAGRRDEAQAAWAETEKRFVALGDKPIELRDGHVIRLVEFPPPPKPESIAPQISTNYSALFRPIGKDEAQKPETRTKSPEPHKPPTPLQKRVNAAQTLIGFHKSLNQSRYEQRDDVWGSRRLIRQAVSQLENGDRKSAIKTFRTAFVHVVRLKETLPKSIVDLAKEFDNREQMFRESAKYYVPLNPDGTEGEGEPLAPLRGDLSFAP